MLLSLKGELGDSEFCPEVLDMDVVVEVSSKVSIRADGEILTKAS